MAKHRSRRYLERHQAKLDAAFRRSFREDARRVQKNRCDYCHEPLSAKTATADHVKARACFGLDQRNNIVAACEPCNKLKGKMEVGRFRLMISKPAPGDPAGFWLAWSRRRINIRLDLMAKRLGVSDRVR